MGMERGIIMLDHHPIICFVYFQAHGSTKSKPPNEVGHHLLNYHLFLHLVHLVHYLVHCTRTLRTGLNNKKKMWYSQFGVQSHSAEKSACCQMFLGEIHLVSW